MHRTSLLPTLLTLGILLTACPGEGWELEERTDDGSACLVAPTADAEGTVFVYANVCLSSSCDRNEQASCTATLDGETITVTSEFSWETATGNVDCTDDCGALGASCEVGPLAEGSYTMVHGDESETLSVPTSEDCEPW